MGFSNMMMAAAKSIPKSTMTQSMPSFTYSSCSTTNMWWLKNCCSFSFTKLMEICSKPLYSKISNPAMSSTAQKLAFFREASMRVSLHLSMSHLKMRSKMALAIPPVAMVACSQVWPLMTHSVPTLILGLQKALNMACGLHPKAAAAFPANVSMETSAISAWSSRPLVSYTMPPQVITPAVNVAIEFLLLGEPKNIESILGVKKLLVVIDGVDLGLALADVDVVVDVRADEALCPKTSRADVV